MNLDVARSILDSFFLVDGQKSANGSTKRSVLLALERDISFCILLPKVWKNPSSPMQLTDDKYDQLQKLLPTFTVISQFCTAVDVLSRVDHKTDIPPIGKNSEFFKNCAVKWFELSVEESKELWKLRNGISHGYRVIKGHATRQYGYGGITKKRNDGTWEFYLHAMYGSLQKAKRKIYESIKNMNDLEIINTASYLEQSGFFYTR